MTVFLKNWENPPEWIVVLAETCAKEGQRKAAERIGYTNAVVSSVLSQKYKGNYSHVEMAVRGALMSEVVMCPAIGEITKDRCRTYQTQPFSNHNPQRIALWRACRDGCPMSRHTSAERKEG
jgi:hypothetical protein